MEKREVLELVEKLLANYLNNEELIFDSKYIENILFLEKGDGTKYIRKDIFYLLKKFNLDMNGVSFDNVHISGYHFNGFKNVLIDLEKVPNKNLNDVIFYGVKLKGNLEGANIRGTKFSGYIGDLILDPQKLKHKDLSYTDLSNITISGNLNGVFIHYSNFENAKGIIRINPQLIKDKTIKGICCKGIEFVGDYNEKTNSYSDPCFDGCDLNEIDFEGHLGNVVINPQKLLYKRLWYCNFSGVQFNGSFNGVDIDGSSFENSTGAIIDLNSIVPYEDCTTDLTDATVITKRIIKKENPILSLIRKKKREN